MYYSNVNGLSSKLTELKVCLDDKNVDIACVTETHFTPSLFEAEVIMPGYSIFRHDRDFLLDRSKPNSNDCSLGGGSVIYVKDYLNAEIIETVKGPDSVAVLLDTNLGKIVIACIYRSPSLNKTQDLELHNFFKNLNDYNGNIEKVFFGDFNFTDVSWVSGNVAGPQHTTNSILQSQKRYLDTVHNAGLTWLLTDEITRRRLVNNVVQESLLDQVLYTDESLVNEFTIGPPLGKSDHVSILVELNVCRHESVKSKVDDLKRNWSNINNDDILKLADGLSWAYSNDVELLSVQEMWDEIHGKLCTITDSVPLNPAAKSNSSNNNNMPWINTALKRARKVKEKMWAKFDSNPNSFNLNIALDKQIIFENLETKAKVKYEKKITSNLKTNSKGFYAYLRSRRKVKSIVTALEKDDGSRTASDLETAECFSDAFSSVFVTEPFGPLPKHCYKDNSVHCNNIDDILIDNDAVQKELSKLNIYKSFGPDNVHPKLLKALSQDISFVDNLSILFRKCASEGNIPLAWKTADVISLHKKGSKKLALNYRPVSLTCILCKVYEQFIRKHLLTFVEEKIIVNQHGFVSKKSCFSNLLETVDTIIDMLENGAPVDVFYFDFCKAFDSVPHYRLLTKLENLGITGSTLEIIRDFLSGRSMRTVVRGVRSNPRKVLSGVPQGSVLGPLLFVLFINDLPGGLTNVTKLFADDLKLICNASKPDDIMSDIRLLESWESTWLLKFNPTKCKVMHLNYNENVNGSFCLDNVMLESIHKEKDLGLIITDKLDWEEHIRFCIKEANRLIAWITRNIILKDQYVMLNIYKSLIRPKLEYCVQIWNPTARHGNWSIILDLECVQRRFTRLINNIGPLPYSERLRILKLTTLAERRVRGDLIETYKILSESVTYGQEVFKTGKSKLNIITKCKDGSSSEIRKLRSAFLPERVKAYWNKLPISVKLSGDVLDFKIKLESFKSSCIHSSPNNFWEVSQLVLEKIEGPSYLLNKEKHNKYLLDNPIVAKKKGINLFTYSGA